MRRITIGEYLLVTLLVLAATYFAITTIIQPTLDNFNAGDNQLEMAIQR